jgi:O-phospho-L-seryl-tRNASec:L-selenocysteinyl-tRNA synthase
MDRLEEIGEICKKFDIFHLLNNAYGLQCNKIANAINITMKKQKLDLVV